MLLVIRLILLALLLFTHATAQGSHGKSSDINFNIQTSNASSGTRVAVIVGVSEYLPRENPSEELPQLSYAADDALLLAETFTRQGYDVITFTDFKADKNYILNTLAQLEQPPQSENSSIVFAFSGHGFQYDNVNYMALGNTDLSRIKDTALSVNQIKLVLSQLGFKQRILLIDACRNTPTRNISGLNLRFAEDKVQDGSAVMYSTAAGALAYEDPALEHGVFSYFVAQGIDRLFQEENEVTFDGLFGFVRERVAFHVASKFKRSQKPYFSGERSGDLILVPDPDKRAPEPIIVQPIENTSTPQTPKDNTPELRITPRWRRIAIGIGIVVVGGLIASSTKSARDDGSNNVTLVVPTP